MTIDVSFKGHARWTLELGLHVSRDITDMDVAAAAVERAVSQSEFASHYFVSKLDLLWQTRFPRNSA